MATIANYVLGRVALCRNEFMEATHHFNESLALWRETGDARTAPAALAGLGCVAVAEGRLDEAREVLAHALDIGYKVGSR